MSNSHAKIKNKIFYKKLLTKYDKMIIVYLTKNKELKMTFSEFNTFRANKLNEIKELSKAITASSRGIAFEEIAGRNAQCILSLLAEIEAARKSLPEKEV